MNQALLAEPEKKKTPCGVFFGHLCVKNLWNSTHSLIVATMFFWVNYVVRFRSIFFSVFGSRRHGLLNQTRKKHTTKAHVYTYILEAKRYSVPLPSFGSCLNWEGANFQQKITRRQRHTVSFRIRNFKWKNAPGGAFFHDVVLVSRILFWWSFI